MNFKKETYDAITESGHKREDVMFVGSSDGAYRMNMDDFDKYGDFNYDSGCGAAEIAQNLIIYFYDNTYLKAPRSKVGWCDVAEIN